VRGETLTGEFKQGDATGSFSFTRASQAPPPPRQEDISFPSGDLTLAGTIFIPAGKGPHPGIVFLHGSGAEGRWASNFLAAAFARRGFAALAFDKRGVGKSGGDWQGAGFEDLAADAAAAVAALSAKPYVVPGKVGIHGHSQGGILAPLVARRLEHPAFVIASAGSGLSLRETETYSVENSLGIQHLPPAEAQEARAFVSALMDVAYGGQPYEHAVAAWQKVQQRPWAFGLPPATHAYWTFSRKIAAYDVLSQWRQVAAPTLLVFGEGDERVPPRASAARIAEAYLGGQGTSFQALFFPVADHTFRLHPDHGGAFAWPRTAPGYPEALIRWAAETVGLAPEESRGATKRSSDPLRR
jgi:dipeptidyl aminopeptidase/acylaminoacyl peptidase